MSDKFDSVPVEKDTVILYSQKCRLGEYEILYQKWFWSGITAESFIFFTEDIQEMSDNDLAHEARTSPAVKSDSKITIKRSDSDFTFVNFNFEV